MKKRIRWFSGILVLIQVMSVLCLSPVYAEERDTVSLILGKEIIQDGITSTDKGLLVERDGRYGRQLSLSQSINYFWCNVDDAFAFDVPRYTAFELVIEYYDEGKGQLALNYDSWDRFSPYFGEEYGSTGPLMLTATNEWKTATFYLENMRLAGRFSKSSDLRIGLYGPIVGWSGSDIILGSISLKKVKHREPLEILPATSAKYGKIFLPGEAPDMTLHYFNKADCKLNDTMKIVVTDDRKNVVWEEEKAFTANPGETTDVSFSPQGDYSRYAIYDVNISHTVEREDEPGVPYMQTQHFEFSRSSKVTKPNQRMGSVQQVWSLSRGTKEAVTETLTQTGSTWIRDGLRWNQVELEKGVLEIPELAREIYEYEKNGGLTILNICSQGNKLYDPNGVNGAAPETPEALAALKKHFTYMASELKGIVDHYEMWNEWNVATFNPTDAGDEAHFAILKTLYEGVKAGNPNATVVGLDTAEIPMDMIERLLEMGAYDYMDAYSTHPYDWSGTFRLDYFKDRILEFRELMDQYGPRKTHIISEAGFSSYRNHNGLGYTYPEQAYNSVKLHLWSHVFELAEVVTQYSFLDQLDPEATEENWGWVRSYNNPETPYGAKPSYLAISAYNRFAGPYEYTGERLEQDGEYHAFRFYNDELNKDVVILTSEGNEKNVTYDFGCNQVELYDISGNKISDLYSENGQYTLLVNPDIHYVIGNINKFEMVEESAPPIVVEKTALEVTADDVATLRFTKNTNKNLTLKVEEMDHIKVIENNGFQGNKAEVKLSTSENSFDNYRFYVYAKDEAGNTFSQIPVTITIKDPIVCEIVTEQTSQDNFNHWQARVTVKNVSETKTLSGTITVTNPEEYRESMPVKNIVNLQPGKSRDYMFNLPYQVISKVANMNLEIALNTGETFAYEQKIDFGTASYADVKPVIDGEISSKEWQGSWIGSDKVEHVKLMSDWGGPDDLSFSGCVRWDEENFYFLSVVTDNIYNADAAGRSDYVWRGDSMQFGLDDRDIVNPIDAGVFTQFDVGDKAGFGPTVFRRSAYRELPTMVDAKDYEFAIKRYADYTVFELKIPWVEVFGEEFVPYEGKRVRFSLCVNDNDGNGRRGWIEYNGGVASGRSIEKFGTLILTK